MDVYVYINKMWLFLNWQHTTEWLMDINNISSMFIRKTQSLYSLQIIEVKLYNSLLINSRCLVLIFGLNSRDNFEINISF